MQTAPPYRELAGKAGISPSYANEIVNGRLPARSLAIHIFRRTGWRHDSIAELTDEQMAMLEVLEPWSPRPTPEQPASAAA